MPPTVAVFDFDGTITRKDSLLPFLRMMVGIRLPLKSVRALPALAGYAAGLIPNGTAKEELFRSLLKGRREIELEENGARFAHEIIPRLVRPEAIERIREHRAKGHILALVSASLEAYLVPWGRWHGFDVVAGTRLEVNQGILTGRLLGLNCWGPEKVHRLAEALGGIDGRSLIVYGDSAGDHDLMKVASVSRYRSLAPNA